MPARTQPNIILINCDDLGYGDLGCYGSEVHDTPAIDRLAGEGCRFTDFYMASPVCSASRSAMLTGSYPARIGFDAYSVLMPGQAEGLHHDEITIASILKSRGYATRLIGKWHCGDQPEFLPTQFGFDGYFGIPFSNDMGRQEGADDIFPPLPLMRDESVIEQQPDQRAVTERYTEDAVDFIRNNSDGPFFLYLAHMHVHLPHYPPLRFLEASRNGPYGGAVMTIDWSTGVIMDELRELGIDQNTLVVFTSDNGSNTRFNGSNAPLRGTKGQTWEGGMRVPCIMRWPEVIPAGSECNGIAASIDFLPTFAAIADAAVPQARAIDGVNLGSLLQDPDTPSPRDSFFYYRNTALDAVRHGPWKLFLGRHDWGEDDTPVQELYNLDEEISEQNNRYAERPEIVAELTTLAENCRQELGDTRTGVEGNDRRSIGRVESPSPLTSYDPDHPYIIAMYDLPDRG